MSDSGRALDDKLTAGLERVGQALRVLQWDGAKDQGLNPIQLQLLLRLRDEVEADRRVGALARRFDLSAASVSDSVRALENKGLLTRREDPEDRRAWVLELTGKGREMAATVEGWADPVRAALDTFAVADKQAALALVLQLIAELQASGVITVARMCHRCRFLRHTPQGEVPYHCAFLDLPLRESELRLDCDDFQPRLEPSDHATTNSARSGSASADAARVSSAPTSIERTATAVGSAPAGNRRTPAKKP